MCPRFPPLSRPSRRPWRRMLKGVRIGVDVGTVRVGVAASDPDGILAFPVDTVPRSEVAAKAVADIATERATVEVFVGMPRHLSGAEGASAADARLFAAQLAELLPVPIRFIDERMSSNTAQRALREAGRSAKRQRGVVDQAAAVVILDVALDAARRGNLGTVAPEMAREENHD